MKSSMLQKMFGKRSKYGNERPTWIGKIEGEVCSLKFDSKGEMGRWDELLLLEKAGVIQSLERQKKYVLQERFRDIYNDNKWIAAEVYKSDFYYFSNQDDRWVAEDFKGVGTSLFRSKWKRAKFQYQNENLEFRLSGYGRE